MNETIHRPRVNPLAAVRIYDAVRAVLALVGAAAVVHIALPVARDAIQQRAASPSAADSAAANYSAGVISASYSAGSAAAREQQAVAEFLARRFRVAEEAVARFVTAAYRAGSESRVDPLLILAVIAIESRFNPVAESVIGAKGLMQVIPKFHMDKVELAGGQDMLLEPEANIRVGAQILREYLRRFGETETALQMYSGASDGANSAYSSKVLAERSRLEQMLARSRRSA